MPLLPNKTMAESASQIASLMLLTGDGLLDCYQVYRDKYIRTGNLNELSKMLEKVRI